MMRLVTDTTLSVWPFIRYPLFRYPNRVGLLGYFRIPACDHLSNRTLSGFSPSAAAAEILVKKRVSALVESVAYIVSSASTAHLKSPRNRQALLLRSYRSALFGSSLSPSSATFNAVSE